MGEKGNKWPDRAICFGKRVIWELPLNWEGNRLDWEDNQLDWEDNLQALQNRIWDLGLNSKNPYKGKIQAFGAKLGIFGTSFEPFWDF